MASSEVIPAGIGTVHPASTRARWENPPQASSPRPQPFTTTRSPTATSGESDAATVPARSIPGTIGKFRTMGDESVTARPSLKLTVEYSTSTSTSPSGRSSSDNSTIPQVKPSSGLSTIRALNIRDPPLALRPGPEPVRSATEHCQPLFLGTRLEHEVVPTGLAHRGRGLRRVEVARIEHRLVRHPGEAVVEAVVQGSRVTSR